MFAVDSNLEIAAWLTPNLSANTLHLQYFTSDKDKAYSILIETFVEWQRKVKPSDTPLFIQLRQIAQTKAIEFFKIDP